MLSAKKELFTPSGGGYQISRSVRLRSSASAYLNRTPSVSGSSTTWTWSGWIKRGVLGVGGSIFYAGVFSTSNDNTGLQFRSDDTLQIFQNNGATTVLSKITTQVFRDPSAWYHIVLTFDTTNATAEDRVRIYVNGTRVTAFSTNTNISQNGTTYVNSTSYGNRIFRDYATAYLDGYLTEVNFIDGQALTPSSFGETNALTGVWQPKRYVGTYGNNGFYLNFSDNSAATATTIGKDYSGNSNNWTPNNISVTAGTTYDSMLDVPTLYADGGNGRGNYSVMNPLAQEVAGVVIDGNLRLNNTAASNGNSRSTIAFPSSGLWYVEGTVGSTTSASVAIGFGIILASVPVAGGLSGYNTANTWSIYASNISNLNNNGSVVGSGGVFTAGDVLQVAVDRNNNRIWIGKNNTWYNSTYGTTGDPSTGANPTFTSVTANDITLFAMAFANSFAINFGQRSFTYTPPTGFKALNTQNLPDATIKKGNLFFDATAYAGTGSTQNIVNSGAMQPDLLWIKCRSSISVHDIVDSVRGVNKALSSNTTAAELTGSFITSLNSNGFTLPANTTSDAFYTNIGSPANTFVGWQWNAGGSTVTNTDGSISAQVRANPTAGFSVVTYTGTGANATIGHGLGVAPKMVIVKLRSGAGENWNVWHTSLASTTYRMLLNTTGAVDTTSPTIWSSGGINPTSTTFTVGTATGTNGSSSTFVAYCFAAVAGYSAFGSYTGNGSADGPFVYLGFRPRWVMIKRFDSTGYWIVEDSSRNTYNAVQNELFANASDAEYVGGRNVDFLSNGFKLRHTDITQNASGGTYIYAAFAESPFRNSLAR